MWFLVLSHLNTNSKQTRFTSPFLKYYGKPLANHDRNNWKIELKRITNIRPLTVRKRLNKIEEKNSQKMVQNRIFSIEMFHASYFHCYFSHDQKHLRAMHRTQWVYHGKQMFTKQWNRIDSHSRWLETEYTKIKSVVIAASFNRNMTNVEIFVFRQM